AVRGGRALLPLRKLPVDDYSAWERVDDEDADAWCRRVLGDRVVDSLLGPVVEGFYFQPLAGMSRALPLALGSIAARRPRTLTLRGGVGVLPEALAEGLDVELRTRVDAVEPAGGGVRVHTGGAALECGRVVLATTAPVAARLYEPASAAERGLLATAYSSTIVVAVATAPGWRPPAALRDVYGLLVSRAEGGVLAAVGIESHKGPDRVPEGELLAAMVAGDAAAELLALSDGEVAERVLADLERHFPAVSSAVRFTRCYRWPEAEPCSPPGRSRLIAAYRRMLPAASTVVLAGDYLGMPFTEGAAEAGRWSASHVAAASLEGG
ncbi:MAG TPA: FAD-dependent oxidoreductase, partial [Gaiellaceae bacterium]|nr:FAD-dependent oxidoreductase [Gaiellaceae bacterium]